MTATSVIVTRPERSAAAWVQQLRALGFVAHALPLLEICPEPMNDALQAARAGMDRWHAIMFVSGNAVRYFFRGEGVPPHADTVRAWSPGPGTTAALLACGWPETRLDGPSPQATQFDSESLWQQVAPQITADMRVLIVRGGDAAGHVAGRDWLARRLIQADVQLDQLVCYRRVAPQWMPSQYALARVAATDGSIWVFSSGQAIVHLTAALPRQDWSAAVALATHPRIAEAARLAGFGQVHDTHPVLTDVVVALKGLA